MNEQSNKKRNKKTEPTSTAEAERPSPEIVLLKILRAKVKLQREALESIDDLHNAIPHCTRHCEAVYNYVRDFLMDLASSGKHVSATDVKAFLAMAPKEHEHEGPVN